MSLTFFVWDGALCAAIIFALILRLRKLKKRINVVRDRIFFFDYLKAFGIVSILAIHVSDLIPQSLFFKYFFSYSVSLFLIVSGYLLAARYPEKFPLEKYYKRVFYRVFLIYFILSIIIYTIQMQRIDPVGLFWAIIFGRVNNNLWFIPMIVELYLIFPLLNRYKKQLLHPISIILIFIFSYYFNYVNEFLQKPDWNSNQVSLIFIGRYLIYFVIGMYISQFDFKEITFKQILPVLILFLASILFWATRDTFNLTYLYSLLVFILLLALNNLLAAQKEVKIKILSKIGQLSLVIYIVSTRILYDIIRPIIYSAQNIINSYWLASYALIILALTFSSYLVSQLFMYLYNKTLYKFGIFK